jgi:hypothetical protein
MRRRKSNILLSLLLLLVCGALGWVILGQLELEPQLEANANCTGASPTPVPELPPELHFNPPPIEALQAVLERPVFAPGRRPLSEDAVELPAPKTLSFLLKGIVIDGDERVAVVIPKDKGKAMLLREGDIAEGWTLVRIEVDHVVLARGDAETVLEPSYERSEPRRRNRQKNTGQNESQQ